MEAENIFRFNAKIANPKPKIDFIYFPDAKCGNGNDGKTF
jgi:hypothetical protein